jgi:opacity protein-like surface antigen
MKKIVLSMAAAMTMSSFAMAGGDLAPVPVVAPDESGIYFGIGYSYLKSDTSSDLYQYGDLINSDEGEYSTNAGLFLLGYKYNRYLSFEGRYTYAFEKYDSDIDDNLDYDFTLSNLGLYVKPHYSFGDFTVYALVGYGWTMVEWETEGEDVDKTNGGFQWGLGASYALSEHTSIFIDYTAFADSDVIEYDDGQNTIEKDEITDIYTINVGMTYKF